MRRRRIAEQQEVADAMLRKSKDDLSLMVPIKNMVNETLERMQQLNQENNFSARIAAVYGIKR